jgi:hypothetical protein
VPQSTLPFALACCQFPSSYLLHRYVCFPNRTQQPSPSTSQPRLRLINSTASHHWRLFSAVNYFDRHGIFISAVVSAPLCAVAFVVVITQARHTGSMWVAGTCWRVTVVVQVYQAGQLLVIVKRKVLLRAGVWESAADIFRMIMMMMMVMMMMMMILMIMMMMIEIMNLTMLTMKTNSAMNAAMFNHFDNPNHSCHHDHNVCFASVMLTFFSNCAIKWTKKMGRAAPLLLPQDLVLMLLVILPANTTLMRRRRLHLYQNRQQQQRQQQERGIPSSKAHAPKSAIDFLNLDIQ